MRARRWIGGAFLGAWLAASAVPAHGVWVGYDVDIPSPEATGVVDGTLAARIWTDGTSRYADGAPAVVFVLGGESTGTLAQQIPQAAGVVLVCFLFPGGVDVPSGRSSDGVYDFRGPASIAALRDMALFAAGEVVSSGGQTISEVVGLPVLTSGIGLLGSSNGGNIVLAAAAEHGAALADKLRWIVQWESPVSSQAAVGDNRGPRVDCSGGGGGLGDGQFGVNPRYLAYGALTLDIDYSDVRFRPAEPDYPLFLDGDGDLVYTTVEVPGEPGCVTNDLDLDGTLELDEDYPLSAYPGAGGLEVYSRPLTDYLGAHPGVFGGPWPAWIATAAVATLYWDEREAVRLYELARAAMPQLFGSGDRLDRRPCADRPRLLPHPAGIRGLAARRGVGADQCQPGLRSRALSRRDGPARKPAQHRSGKLERPLLHHARIRVGRGIASRGDLPACRPGADGHRGRRLRVGRPRRLVGGGA